MGLKRAAGKAVAATVGGLTAAAVANRAIAGRASELEPPLPGELGTYRWRGLDVSYTEAGDPEDPDLVLLHGLNAAATSREFAPIVDRLAEDHHVLAPDLPGFGLSERPPLVYTASLYESFVESFVRDLTDDPTCIASSLAGAYALSAGQEGASYERLVLICPTARTVPGRRLWLRTLLRSPVLGETLYNAMASRASIRYFAADHGYYDVDNKPEGLAEYQWQCAHQPGGRYAPASFVSGYLDSEVELAPAIDDLNVPTTLVWGRETELTPLSEGRELADRADCRLVVIDYADLQPHAEHPEQFLEAVEAETSTARD